MNEDNNTENVLNCINLDDQLIRIPIANKAVKWYHRVVFETKRENQRSRRSRFTAYTRSKKKLQSEPQRIGSNTLSLKRVYQKM